jgi:uncharacterized protein YkwD
VPVLIGLGTGAAVAVAVVAVGPMHRDPTPGPSSVRIADAAAEGVEGVPALAVNLPAVDPAEAPKLGTALLPLFLPGYPPYLPALIKQLPKVPEATPKATPEKTGKLAPKPAGAYTGGLSGLAAQVVALTNKERAKKGCKPLKVDARLNKAAMGHSVDMAKRDYFEHESPEGKDFEYRENKAGYKGMSGGENIAVGQTSAQKVMSDWMGSPGHRRNILDCSYDSIGVGYTPNGNYWTQNFGGGADSGSSEGDSDSDEDGDN